MVDLVTFRTTDPTRWGTGQGTRLGKSTIDTNFWVLLTRLLLLEEHQLSSGAGIHSFYQPPADPTQFFVILTDGSQLGPYSLPQTTWNFTNPPTGQWVASSGYSVNDVFLNGVTLYQVLVEHTSSSTFDAGATDGLGNDLYKVLLTAFPPLPISTVATATYTLALADANLYLRMTNAGGCAVTVPPGVFPVNTEIELRDASTVDAGGLSLVAGAGVTLNGVFGYANKTAASGGTLGLKQVATNIWDVAGLMALA